VYFYKSKNLYLLAPDMNYLNDGLSFIGLSDLSFFYSNIFILIMIMMPCDIIESHS